MTEEQFWNIVAESQGSANTLKRLLVKLPKEAIIAFDALLDEALYQLDREDIHNVTDGSDDGFEYVRLWIVSQGHQYFESVLRDPANAPHYADEEQENEAFGYAAWKAYEEQSGAPFPLRQSKRATGTNPEGWS